MADAVNAGLDLHALFAANRDGVLADLDLNRMTEPDVAAVIKSRIAAYKDDKKLKPRRQLAKMANFLTGVTLLKSRCENVENCWNSPNHQIATV